MTHVRYADISGLRQEDWQRLYAQADPERRSRADRYLRKEDGCRCIVADALLRYAVRRELGTGDYQVERTPEGKPYLKDRPDFHFSLTHSGRWVAIAWGPAPVGLDVEQFRMDEGKENIARRFFCPDEQAYVFAAQGEERTRRFFRLWTMKESYLKYRGTGLKMPLTSFSVLQPQLLGVTFTGSCLEDAALSLCAQTPEMTCYPLTLGEI